VLSGFPNPARGTSLLRLVLPDAAVGLLTIHHPNGRIVRTITRGRLEAGESILSWDGRDDAGDAVPSGVYFARMVGSGLPATLAAAQTKVVLAR
jgi:flagellar hook assembly protein FlgD